MNAVPESNFPTLQDLRDGLSRLVESGLGALPVQVLVVPDSTMQAIARISVPGHDHDGRPALMIELDGGPESRLPVTILSTDRWSRDGGMQTTKAQ